ncbi:glutamine synthetase family protein [Phaeobacter marinintestinus]|uniref:glutamine synthetase family protein n=1 Tax=Falsiphaeobacter marinintestinus TaxID=1492905 RepID=UPI0011B64447|nr:glutamine synthetase family protein [Phaeobacter marinintestinus]
MIDDYLNDPQSRFATVAMTDTNGLLRSQMVSINALKSIVTNGMPMAPAQLALDPTDEMLHVPGVTDDNGDFHDGMLTIDRSTARKLPWSKPGHDLLVLSQFGDENADICPRAILSRVLERAQSMGITPFYGLEMEYTLFDETEATARAKGYRGLKTATLHKSHDLLAYQVLQSEWYEDVATMCDALGIRLAKMHEEIGGGFMECCVEAGSGMAPADQLVLLKNFLRILAMRQEKSVTFMPRWSEQADSQSMHLHVSLLDADGTPVFHDPDGDHQMSDTFRHFIGGLQKHVGDLSLMFLPTVNSYRRFAPGTFAPPALTWGYENRTTCFRVVGHSPSSIRVENRLAGSDVNPYLNVAATLAAGLDGIENKTAPLDEVVGAGFGLEGVPDYARSMPEAIERLRGSALADQWLGARFADCFAASRQSQLDAFSAKVPDVELERFFDLG